VTSLGGLLQAFATQDDPQTQHEELKSIRQYPNKKLRDFVQRFRIMVNTITNLTKRDMISTFVNGVGNPTCSIALGSMKLLDG
jgi:hypothetical protein